jgi:hypothetical protein
MLYDVRRYDNKAQFMRDKSRHYADANIFEFLQPATPAKLAAGTPAAPAELGHKVVPGVPAIHGWANFLLLFRKRSRRRNIGMVQIRLEKLRMRSPTYKRMVTMGHTHYS